MEFETRHLIRIFGDTWQALRDSRITVRAALLEARVNYDVLYMTGEQKSPHWDYTMPELMQILQCTENTVRATIKLLVKAKMLEVSKRGPWFRMKAKLSKPGTYLVVAKALLETWERGEFEKPMLLLVLSRLSSFWKGGHPFHMTNVSIAKEFGIKPNTASHLIDDLKWFGWIELEHYRERNRNRRRVHPSPKFLRVMGWDQQPEEDD